MTVNLLTGRHVTCFYRKTEPFILAHDKLAPKLISGIKSFLRALKVNKFSRIASKLSGTTYKGTIYRAITRGGDADAFKIHPGNISANHRYTKPGKGGLYVGTSRDVVKLEVKGASEIYTRKNVEINCASPPRLDNILLKDWCKSLRVTISHCLPITSAEIDFIRRPILECRMNPPGVVKIHIMLDAEAKLR